ncbi:hypothetical protein MKQ70_32135 [Chitinophaga sedimenti]|uniref:hypothetical protein n=1 Tax=Chitinophaga sedimenti TaxID=2033606 RepID=UPI002004A754|nr:hypothetical protein [Chitinophaga sedimenti]MCK7559368.1 hypothetical protein [Chitinophaga sedimenti]
MKKLMILIAAIICSVATQAQSFKESPLSPQWTSVAKKLSKEEFNKISVAKFKNPREYAAGSNLYQDGNSLVMYVENEQKANESVNFEEKLQFYRTMEKKPNSTLKLIGHEIQKIDGKQVLVVNYEFRGDHYYTFISEVYGGNKYLFGHIQYLPKDSAGGKATLSHLFTRM